MSSQEADRQFFEKSRKLSPQFPDINSVIERQQRARETVAARLLLLLTLILGVSAPFAEKPWWMAASALACFIGFVITCFVAGNRAHVRAGGSGGRPC